MASDLLASSRTPLPDTDFASEYDIRTRITSVDKTLAAWAQQGETSRTQNHALLDQPYGVSAAERLDYFRPPDAHGPRPPLLVFLHGGFWQRLDKRDFSWVAPPYTAHGIAVAVMNYGLAPATRLEEMVEQTRRGIQWLYSHADQLGFDRQRIIIAGHSAGGHLACMALCTNWAARDNTLPPNLLAGGIILSPLSDLAPLAHVPALETDIGFTPERIQTLSPIHHPPPAGIPLIAAVGGRESREFKRQLALLAAAWPAVQNGLVALPDDDHLSICNQFAQPDTPLFNAALTFIHSTGDPLHTTSASG